MKNAREHLYKQLAPLLRQLGATENEHREFTLQTRLGAVRVCPDDTWVGVRFLDVAEAREHFAHDSRFNPHSGKWNWHAWDVMGVDQHNPHPRPRIMHLVLLAQIVWRELEDLTHPATVESAAP